MNVLINIGPGAGGGRKKRGEKGNLPNTFDDDCRLFLVYRYGAFNSLECYSLGSPKARVTSSRSRKTVIV